MKAIVGLGNPGASYRGTRHNIGFAVVDEIARRAAIRFESAPANAVAAKWRRTDGLTALLVKPLTFMNESGQAVGELARYFKIDLSDLLIVVDEVQLPLGKLRARPRGSAGGHNGLKSIIAHLGLEFPRLRVGIGRGLDPGDRTARPDLTDHVLSRFDAGERDEVSRMTARAGDATELFITSGIEAVMNAYNGDPPGLDPGIAE
jgi:PTH1 family peptidyl-tRNA hydrolase